MTLSVSWIRTVGRMQELIFASDSRYRSFGAWDCAPKLFELHGTGGIVGLSGDTEVALAIVCQLQNAINQYAPFADGAVDITHVIGHFLSLMNNMGREISDKKGFTEYFSSVGIKAGFIVGGYSHVHQCFKMAHILYRRKSDAFVRRPPIRRYKSAAGTFHYVRSAAASKIKKPPDVTSVCVIGDYIDECLNRLSGRVGTKDALDMEPLQVLVEMLRSKSRSKKILSRMNRL